MKNKKYWYKHFHEECPICGTTDDYKVRIYDVPRPEKIEDRHVFNYMLHCCE